jgi:hypothetical protein
VFGPHRVGPDQVRFELLDDRRDGPPTTFQSRLADAGHPLVGLYFDETVPVGVDERFDFGYLHRCRMETLRPAIIKIPISRLFVWPPIELNRVVSPRRSGVATLRRERV